MSRDIESQVHYVKDDTLFFGQYLPRGKVRSSFVVHDRR
jgi:hypothetical protein